MKVFKITVLLEHQWPSDFEITVLLNQLRSSDIEITVLLNFNGLMLTIVSPDSPDSPDQIKQDFQRRIKLSRIFSASPQNKDF